MSETVKFNNILEAFKNAPIGEKIQKPEGQSVIQGPINIDSGDAILIKGDDSVELDAFTLFFSLGMTMEGDLFAGLHCSIPQNVIFVSGRVGRTKFEKNIFMMNAPYDRTRFKLITNDQLIEKSRLDLQNVVLHQNILEILKSNEGQSVIVFDNSSSLILSDPKKIDKVSIRSFVQKLIEMNVIQIWSCPESKRTKILPENCFDFIFGVKPEKEAENVAFMVGLERNAYFYQEKLLQFNLELQPDENGKQTLVEKDLMFDKRYLAIGLAAQGKTQAEIGEYLGKDQSTISHWLRKAENDGLISRNGNKYTLTQKGRKVQPGRNQR